jgi:hypothetical protein
LYKYNFIGLTPVINPWNLISYFDPLIKCGLLKNFVIIYFPLISLKFFKIEIPFPNDLFFGFYRHKLSKLFL